MKAKVIKQDGTIIELEGTQTELTQALASYLSPMYTISSVWGSSDIICNHEYPNPWHGIIPPSCTKCGQSACVPFTFSGSSV